MVVVSGGMMRVFCFTVKAADAVSLTSYDSNDSVQSSTLPIQTPIVPSSSSSTVSEDCSSESGQCKSPPLVVSIDLELLRKEDQIVELVALPVQPCPSKSLFDSDTDSDADGANDTVSVAKNFHAVHNEGKMSEIGDQTPTVCDDEFESIYSRALMNPADQQTAVSLDDAIMSSLMNSHPNDFRDIIRPVSFCECPETESDNSDSLNVESHIAQSLIPVPLQSTRTSDNIVSHHATGRAMVVNKWVQLPAPADTQSMSVSTRHIWCVDTSGRLLYSQLRGPGLRWFAVTTAPAQQISVSPSASLVWRLDAGSAYAGCNVNARQPWGNKWTEVARDITWLSVDDHVAW